MQRRTRCRAASATLGGDDTTLTIEQILLLLAPVIVIQLGLMIVALIDLERDERRVRGDNKLVWALIIIFVNIIGPILYFVVGREEA